MPRNPTPFFLKNDDDDDIRDERPPVSSPRWEQVPQGAFALFGFHNGSLQVRFTFDDNILH